MMRSYKLALLSMFTLLGAGDANAQSQLGQAGNSPQFLPTSGWQVQETALSSVRGLEGVNLPCMMATTYNNGYMLRFSGTSDKILAMAIDFRQDVFAQGRKYPAALTVGQGYSKQISGTAFSKSVLIFNMRDKNGFASALTNSEKMTLNVEDNPMLFALGGVNNALVKLQSCSQGGDFTSNVQEASIPQQSAPKAMTWGDKVEPQSARETKSIQKAQAARGQIWQARAGDDLEKTLQGWAQRAGVTLDWQATGDSKVVDDINVQGTFEDAVQNLMARNAAALGLDANMVDSGGASMGVGQSRASVSMPVNAGPQQITPQRMGNAGLTSMPNAPSTRNSGGGQWSAPVGTSLQQVLSTWSKQAGVEVVWQSNQGFAVRTPVAMNGSYEAAVQALLEQYTNEKVRPNAQLNNDPVTGRRTLFIESSRVL